MASRSTFRSAVSDIAWQRQLRDRYAAEGTPPVPHLDLKRAVVRPVSRRTAEQIILKYEWLGTMATSRHHFGIFFGAFCAGVACFALGSGAGAYTHKQYGVEPSDLWTLARGACVHWAPPGTNSKLVAWATRLMSRLTVGKIVVAYADSDAGEIGTVYQAANWTYIGQGSRGGTPEIVAPNGRAYNGRRLGQVGQASQFVAPNGRVYDHKLPYSLRAQRGALKTVSWIAQKEALLAAGWAEQPSNPKHRYVCVLDRSDTALVERIERMRQPYPKRAKHPSDAPGDQPGEGGAAPTRTLQEIH